MESSSPMNIAFAGLGAMGFGMACHLLKLGNRVTGFDVYEPSLARFKAAGGQISSSPRDAANGKDFFIFMVTNSEQVESALFGAENGAIEALPVNATVIICSTVPAAYLKEVQSRLDIRNRSDIHLVDSPVSGGTVRAANGSLTILASGNPAALRKGKSILEGLSEKLFIIPGNIGAASNMKMVNQLLAGVHIAAAAEAMGLAAKMGLNTRVVYDIIINAAGNSWMFENRVPHMLENDWHPHSALDIFVKDMGIVTSSARSHQFPLPLSSAAEQLYISASSQGYGREDDSGVVRIFLPQSKTAVCERAKVASTPKSTAAPTKSHGIQKIGFVGLGAMGLGMATSLVRSEFNVCGYDVYPPSIEKFLAMGGKSTSARSPAGAAKDAEIFILMVQNISQAEDVLFGEGKAAQNLPDGSVVILNSTVPPSAVRSLRTRLISLGKNIDLVDAPVSGGVARAAQGGLTIISSGESDTVSKAKPALEAMSGNAGKLYQIEGGVGAASSVKLINQLLAGVHIAAAAEAMAFGAKLGLDTQAIYEIIRNAAGGSWMFENRVPAMLKADWTPHSALAIFVKDLGIVLDEAKRLMYPATLSAVAHQLYLMGASHGWKNEADGGVVRVWELMAGISVSSSAKKAQPSTFKPREYEQLPLKETINALPQPYKGDTMSSIQDHIQSGKAPVLVVLDDDPTGTQTCHDISVLTVWDPDTIFTEISTTKRGFFILTNSRAMAPPEAKILISEICHNVAEAAKKADRQFEIVLRGDSTLRGHFPLEPEVVEEALGEVDAWILAPFFFQGGRYTINDVHYVAEGDSLVPASQTPFAKDATFGYKSSNLRDYVLEKAGSRFSKDDLHSVTLEDIRIGGPEKVTEKLLSIPKGGVIIVNAAAESDMFVFAAGLLVAERQRKYLYRTGAAFVSSRLGITGIPPLSASDLDLKYGEGTNGGLIVAGSYVPKTTAQLKSLRERTRLTTIELDVSKIIQSKDELDASIQSASVDASEEIKKGNDVLIMTSRGLLVGQDAISSLNIGSIIAAALVEVVKNINVRPRYVIAKGGITSSDGATKGLNMKKAMIVGQASPGVPIWRCDEPLSRHPGIPYVVFPGNVGSETALAELVERWSPPRVVS